MLDYGPYNDRTQMDRQIQRYPKSFTRVPSQPLIKRPLTLTEHTGPANLQERFQARTADLSRTSARAVGQLISVSGRITDEDGRPMAGCVLELWQANSAGKYIHEIDLHKAPLDPNFTGQARLVTNKEGEYHFNTI